MLKPYILFLFSFLIQNIVFAQQFNFEAKRNSYSIYQIDNNQNEVDYLFIYKDISNGFEFEILDKNFNFISKGEFNKELENLFQDYVKLINKVGDKIAITKIYLKKINYAYPLEVTFIYDAGSEN